MTLAIAEQHVGLDLIVQLERTGAITPVSLDLDRDLSDGQVEALATLLGSVKRRTSWWIGDLIVWAEGTMGEKYAQVAAWTGLSEETLQNYVWTCKHVTKSRRRDGVPFSCHSEVAPLPPAEQRRWLTLCAREGLSQRQLRALIRAEQDEATDAQDPSSRRASDPDHIESLARRIWRTAVSDGNGYYRVSSELMAQLASALGEEE